MGVILGTAGHVDHGKTELIKALTGVDTDRLEEEKRRGLTIDLGFAPLDLPRSGTVGIVDVPGHVDYLKNMLAGVGGIDLALLIVAADEGVMPQTIEHFHILKLLRIPQLVIVVTKIDLVDDETRELVGDEVRELLAGTYLEGAPVAEVSPVSGKGLDELKQMVDGLVADFPDKDPTEPPRLLIDRVFVLKGIGTVVTGSLVAGSITEGEELCVYPRMKRTRARQIQVFNKKRETAEPGSRVALNLVGLSRGEVERGDVVSREGAFQPTKLLDVKLELLSGARRLRDWARVRLHLGSGEYLGRAAIMGKKQLEPEEEGFCQLRLEKEVVALYGDRFVIRHYSPMVLLAGGVILHSTPDRHKRRDKAVLEVLKARAEGNVAKAIVAELETREAPAQELRTSLNLKEDDWGKALGGLTDSGKVVNIGGYLFGQDRWEELKRKMVKTLESFHSKFPLRGGMPKEELKRRLAMRDPVFGEALSILDEIEVGAGMVRLKTIETKLSARQLEQSRRLDGLFRKAGFSPPDKGEILRDYDGEIFGSLIANGTLIKVTDDLFFHREAIEEAKRLISGFLKEAGEMRLSDMRDVLGSTRKFVVPLAEYLDSIKFTKRSGDLRTRGNG